MENDNTVLRFKPPLKQFLIDEFAYIILGIICFVIFLGNYAVISKTALFGSFITLAYLVYKLFYIASILYIITSEQLIYMHGVFCHSTEYLELYRVVDYQQQRNLAQQLFKVKTVVIISGDRTMPVLRINGLRDKDDIISEIRDRVEYNKRKRGIYEITNRF